MNSSPLGFFAPLGGVSPGPVKGKVEGKSDVFASLLGACMGSKTADAKPAVADGAPGPSAEKGESEGVEASLSPLLSLFSASLADVMAGEDVPLVEGQEALVADGETEKIVDLQQARAALVVPAPPIDIDPSPQTKGEPEVTGEGTKKVVDLQQAQAALVAPALPDGVALPLVGTDGKEDEMPSGASSSASSPEAPSKEGVVEAGEGPLLSSEISQSVGDELSDLLDELLVGREALVDSTKEALASLRELLARDDLQGPLKEVLASFRETVAAGRDLAGALDEALASLREVFAGEEAFDEALSAFDEALAGGKSVEDALRSALSLLKEAMARREGPPQGLIPVGGGEMAPRSGRAEGPLSALSPSAEEPDGGESPLRPIDPQGDLDGDFSRGSSSGRGGAGDFDRLLSSQTATQMPTQGGTGPEAIPAAGTPLAAATEGALAEELPRRLSTSFPLVEGLAEATRATVSLSATRAYVVVEPPSLGRVDILLHRGAEGMEATLRVDNEGLRQLVSTQLDQLRLALQQSGIALQGLSVDVRSGSGQPRWAEAKRGAPSGFTDDDDAMEFSIDLEEGLLSWMA